MSEPIQISNEAREAARKELVIHSNWTDIGRVHFMGSEVQLAINAATLPLQEEVKQWKQRYDTRCLCAENDTKEEVKETVAPLQQRIESLDMAVKAACECAEQFKLERDTLSARVAELEKVLAEAVSMKVGESAVEHITRVRLAAYSAIAKEKGDK